jgi:NAD(P)-dependent dehydrogenase (short-subunit alcohol dehydrogenase family)
MKVVLADVEAAALDDAVGRLRAGGAEAVGVITDVARADSVQALADRTLEAYGAVHLVCNNAGVMTGAPFEEFHAETFQWIVDVNFWGVINGCRVFLPLLRGQDEGYIVNTSSTVTAVGYVPIGTAYVASKFAVSGFTEALYRELRQANDSVHVSLLIPGPTDTNIPDAERNLPEGVRSLEGNPTRRVIVEALRGGGSEGLMPPSEVAAAVVEGIRERRFHIMTHPDVTIEAIQARLDWMRTGIEPPRSPVLEPQGV